MPQIPFAFQWQIAENQLLPLKDSINGFLSSTTTSGCYLKIYLNGNNDEHRGQAWVFLQANFNYHYFTLTIESANYSKQYIYRKYGGSQICTTEEFFDPEKKFFVDGKVIVKVNGNFVKRIFVRNFPPILKQKWIGGKLGDELWGKNDTKDFTVIASGGKEINAHKFVLANRSEVFNTTFDLKNESKKAEISDFSFAVVETGIKLIYDCNFSTSMLLYELMKLLQFFDRFGLPALKADVEPYLIKQISASTVVQLTNCSVQTNSSKLKEKCMDFLMAAFQSKTALTGIKTLDKDIALKIIENSQCQPTEPEDSVFVAEEQKWEGGDLGDKIWNDRETKDFTIFVDGKGINAHKFILGVQSQIFKEISKTEETNENVAEIIDFSFNVIETGIKLIYDCNFTTKLSMDELMELQQFLDKYQLPALKTKVEPLLIAEMSASIVCRLTNCSILSNSVKLNKKCIEFLMAAFESKTPLADIKILDKNIALQILENSLYQHVQTVEL